MTKKNLIIQKQIWQKFELRIWFDSLFQTLVCHESGSDFFFFISIYKLDTWFYLMSILDIEGSLLYVFFLIKGWVLIFIALMMFLCWH